MSEPILTHAHNIYEQQKHNRRMTWLLIVVFILLIAAIGVGFDVFLTVDSPVRFILLPFVLLMVASSIWNFRKRAAEGLWKKPQAFADDDDDSDFFKLPMYIVLTTMMLIILLMLQFFPHKLFPAFFNYHLLRYLPIGTILAVIICIGSILTSLHWGMNSVLWSVHAEQPDEAVADLPELLNVVKEMSLAAGIPSPKVYIVKDSDPNAFTIGTIPMDSSIVVTTGLLAMLDREELQGVIAHEMSHIRNSDTRLMTIITVLFGAVLLLSEWMKKGALLGGFAGNRAPGAGWMLRGVLFAGWLLTILLAPLIARIVAMAVSRQREYLADAGGAELTRNPKALANALMKIENATEPTTSFQKGIAHLCVVDPLGRKINEKEGWWADLFATHPPMKNRIMLLNAMAYESRATPEHTAK
ncbi:MAG: M48 family metallopeptidase [Bacteroidota bacterium]